MYRRYTSEFHIGEIDDPSHYAIVYKEVMKHDPSKHGNKNQEYMDSRQQPSLGQNGKLFRRKLSESIIWDQESICHINKNSQSMGWGDQEGSITLSPPKKKKKPQRGPKKIMSQPVINSGPNGKESGVAVQPVIIEGRKAPRDFLDSIRRKPRKITNVS
jgi:hypothetical protein